MALTRDDVKAMMAKSEGWPGTDRMLGTARASVMENGVLLFAIEAGLLDEDSADTLALFAALCDAETINFHRPYHRSAPLNAAIARSISWLVAELLKKGADMGVEGFRHLSVLDYNLKRGPADKTLNLHYTSSDEIILTLLVLYGFDVRAVSTARDQMLPLHILKSLYTSSRIDEDLYFTVRKILQRGAVFSGNEGSFLVLRYAVEAIYSCAKQADMLPESCDPMQCYDHLARSSFSL